MLRWFHPDARRALVHEADLAAVAVRCLLGDVPAGGSASNRSGLPSAAPMAAS